MSGFTKQAQQEQGHNKQTLRTDATDEFKRMQYPCRYQQHKQRRMQKISNVEHASELKNTKTNKTLKSDYELNKHNGKLRLRKINV